MPFADPERNRAAVRDWNRRNRDKVNAAKRRYRARLRARKAVTRVHTLDATRVKLTAEQRRYFAKLRRNKVPLARAQQIAYNRLV